ncbi:hypothetical protein [Acinetobacter sp. ANC 5378]|uniref:hypothetical protein n=1 Tax=Acinetobacter sp. ANC 5378 TaxID=2731249 RepID=UPI00148F8D70|nr:hypothetical protein [Acinetobacter sp. ANC 5378]NNG81413.1 hypothetical protein [Acinetobacter sp. ANC 5378]
MSLNRLQDTLNNYQILCKTCIGICDVELISFSTLTTETPSSPQLHSPEQNAKIEDVNKTKEFNFDVDVSAFTPIKQKQSSDVDYDEVSDFSTPMSNNDYRSPKFSSENPPHIKIKRVKPPKKSYFAYYLFTGLLLVILSSVTYFVFDTFYQKQKLPIESTKPVLSPANEIK